MSSSPFFSIVVPLFNSEKYIAGCIKSILNQSFINYELLIINDASTDNSRIIAESFDDERIRIINHEKNKGLSAARETGIKESRGVYIAWVDSDDYISQFRFEKIYDEIEKNSPDVVITGFVRKNGKKEKNINDCLAPGFYEGETYKEIKKIICTFEKKDCRLISPNVWCKVVRKELLLMTAEKIPYTLKIGEDAARTYSALLAANSLSMIKDNSYYYVQHPEQMTKGKYLQGYFDNAIWIYCFLEDFNREHLFIDDLNMRDMKNQNISHIAGYAVMNEARNPDKKKIKANVERIIKNHVVRSALTERAIKSQNHFYRLILEALKRESVFWVLFYGKLFSKYI